MYICTIQKDITEEFIKILNEFKSLKLDVSFDTATDKWISNTKHFRTMLNIKK
jgi:hypothetical protein